MCEREVMGEAAQGFLLEGSVGRRGGMQRFQVGQVGDGTDGRGGGRRRSLEEMEGLPDASSSKSRGAKRCLCLAAAAVPTLSVTLGVSGLADL